MAAYGVAKEFGRFVGTHPTLAALALVPALLAANIYFNWPSAPKPEAPAAITAAPDPLPYHVPTPAGPVPSSKQRASGSEQQRDAVIGGAARLRNAMHDPQSFKLEDVFMAAGGAGCYTYRATNGFGALRLGYAVLTADRQLHAGDLVAKQWNKHCAGKTGESMTTAAAAFAAFCATQSGRCLR